MIKSAQKPFTIATHSTIIGPSSGYLDAAALPRCPYYPKASLNYSALLNSFHFEYFESSTDFEHYLFHPASFFHICLPKGEQGDCNYVCHFF